MRPSFELLRLNFPKSERQEQLFKEIGWTSLLNNDAYKDTCAIRMSVALLRSGVQLPTARMKITGGALRGKRIEPGQGKLSFILRRLWGEPEKFSGEQAAMAAIGNRSGVVSFFRIHGGRTDGGHIDLVQGAPSGFPSCARSCYFHAASIWFWPLE